jgi:RHS repeat-associated protein
MNGQTISKGFIPLPAGATAVYTGTTLSWYRHSDWLGSSRIASTPGRTVYYDGAYSPMGENYAETGTTDRSFTGQNQDLAPDMYDFLYREYHAPHGRWISPDPAGVAAVDPANPRSWNRYAYVNGEPLRRKDAKGLCTAWVTVTGPTGSCFQGGQAAYELNSSMFDSYSTAPSNSGLSNASGIFDVDNGARVEANYAAMVNYFFWVKVAYNAFMTKWQKGDSEAGLGAAKKVGWMSGGVLDDDKIGTTITTTLTVLSGTGDIVAVNKNTKLTIKDASGPLAPESATWGGPLPFAPGPIFVHGACEEGRHWQPDSYDLAHGSCEPNIPPEAPKTKP